MFRSFKKKATTAFRKRKTPEEDLPDTPDTLSTTTSTTSTNNRASFPPTNGDTGTYTPINTTTPVVLLPPDPPLPPDPTLGHRTYFHPPLPPVPVYTYQPPHEARPPQDPAPPEPEPEPEPVPEPEHPVSDPFAPKYVPFVDASPLKNNMLSNGGVYGRINPDIMGGFGGDDESIWLVDDEETDEEQARESETKQQTQTQTETQLAVNEQAAVSHSPRSSLHNGEQSAAAIQHDPAESNFRYSKPTLLDDFWTTQDGPATETGANTQFESQQTDQTQLQQSQSAQPTQQTEDTQPSIDNEPPATFRGYAPISMSILDLNDLGVDEEVDTPQNPPEDNARRDPAAPASSSSSSVAVNPYVALFEQHDAAMTVAYLRQLDQTGDVVADDFSFGQRYQRAVDSSDVIVTHQRMPASTVTGDLECMVCVETKGVDEFPRFSITGSCTHNPTTCLECVQLSIESDLNGKLWTEIRCPECRELLEYADIQRYANKQTFMRYETLALRAAMSEADNFIWCTSGCGSGQIHESGIEQPIVTCLHCNHRSCFHHNVAWHEALSCEEYDRLLEDPDNFRSRVEIENEEWSETQRAQLEADRAMAQGLLAEERAEMQRREERARQERDQARKAAELVRKIAARRKREDQASQAMVSQTTKPCPGCGWAIEKNDGCSHMTCIKCSYEFCWGCYQIWKRGHSISCQGRR